MAVLEALPEGIRSQVDRVAASTTDDVTLFLYPTGSRVIWGGPEESALKARVLTALIANYPLGSVSAYDVSAPNSAVVS
jgi:cell division protein FtsQ